MKADFTRNSFHPNKHFARVLMQQGRVQLDADWNEQAAILLRYMHTLAADLIGSHGGPEHHCGFEVQPFEAPLNVPGDFVIKAGRYYVDGILCELDPQRVTAKLASAVHSNQVVVASWTVDGFAFDEKQYVELFDSKDTSLKYFQVKNIDQQHSMLTLDRVVSAEVTSLRRVTTYLTQPDLPGPGPLAPGSYFVYLDVWERLITYVEDDSIREVALNGADTAARSKIVCQVKVPAPNVPDQTALRDPPNRGFLRAGSIKTAASTDPCTISPNARYRGPENQLYRVEIHTGSRDVRGNQTKPTFKWSRENGAVVFLIVRSTGTSSFVLESLGHDDRFGLAEGDWVEIQDDDSVLLNGAENLVQVQSIDRPSMTVTLAGTPSSNTGRSPTKHALLRRWDQQFGDPSEGGLEKGDDNAALIVESLDKWLDLENGVQIQFEPPKSEAGETAAQYRTGDYWLIPARITTADVEWPTETAFDSHGNPVQSPLALPPDGITHHYAPLADLAVKLDGTVSVATPLTKKFAQAAS